MKKETITLKNNSVGMPMQGMPMVGMPMVGMPTMGMPMAGMSMAGMPMVGMPMMGMPTMGMPMAGMPMMGMPTMGMPMMGMPNNGSNAIPETLKNYVSHEVEQQIEKPNVVGMERPKMAKATKSKEEALTIVLSGILPGFNKNENLFEQGLSSFNMMQIVTRCGEQGYSITMVDIFRNPTFVGICDCMLATGDEKKQIDRALYAKENVRTHTDRQYYYGKKFSVEEISEEDLEIIYDLYGKSVENVYDLTPGQRWMYDTANIVTNEFFLQMTIKVKLDLKPNIFRARLDEVVKKHESLRSAFVSGKTGKIYRVILENRRAEVVFIDISNVDEEKVSSKIKSHELWDRRRGFNLENDSLLRMTVLKLPGDGDYAFIMSQPHINSDGQSLGLLLRDIFVEYAMVLEGKMNDFQNVSFDNYASWLNKIDVEGERTYWSDILKNLPATTTIPGKTDSANKGTMESYRLVFSDEVKEGLEKSQRKYKATLNTIMQTAWGIMLWQIYGISDVTVGAITSGRDLQVSDASVLTGGFVNSFPVRINDSKDILVSDLISQMQKQFTKSLQNTHITENEIRTLLGRETPVFDHLLNFHNFASMNSSAFNQMSEEEANGFEILNVDVYDNLSNDLCVYFQFIDNSFSCLFTYNKNAFGYDVIEHLAKNYEQVLEQILFGDDKIKACDIKCDDAFVFESIGRTFEKRNELIRNSLEKSGVFSYINDAQLDEIVKLCSIQSYVGDDVIFEENTNSGYLYIVASGMVQLCMESFSEWKEPIKIVKKGAVLSIAELMPDSSPYLTAIAEVDNTKLVVIKREDMLSIIEEYPIIALNLARIAENEAKLYTKLWLKN